MSSSNVDIHIALVRYYQQADEACDETIERVNSRGRPLGEEVVALRRRCFDLHHSLVLRKPKTESNHA